MKRFMIPVLALALLLLAGCAGVQQDAGRDTDCRDAFSPHYEDSYFAVGENCDISAELLAGSSGIRQGSNDIQAILHNQMDQDVTGATLEFFLLGPEGEEKQLSPNIREERGGLYSVNDLQIPNLEERTLVVKMERNTVRDRVLFDLQEMSLTSAEAVSHTHQVMHDAREIPEDLDTSREVESQKGRFTISYSIKDREEIPIGDFHSWKLHVEDAQTGETVNRALIAINGDMPRHGHGMPSNPEAAFLGNGNYRLDGLKFHMPGWWQLALTISTADKYDRAVFNFILEQ
ncbi:MAG: FixH family protein [Desulfohalobiaceae bacterium]